MRGFRLQPEGSACRESRDSAPAAFRLKPEATAWAIGPGGVGIGLVGGGTEGGSGEGCGAGFTGGLAG